MSATIVNSLSNAAQNVTNNAIAKLPAAVQVALPQLPQLPQFPSIPQLPNIPNISSLPSFGIPNISSLVGSLAGSLPGGLGSLLGGSKSGLGTSEPQQSHSTDVVGVFDSSLNQLIDLARPIKASIIRNARVMEHPVEGGALISDFKIILPVEIELACICSSSEYQSTYKQVESIFTGSDTVTIATKAGHFFNMELTGMPHEESVEMFDALPMSLKFKQVFFAQTQYQSLPPQNVQNSSDQSTINTGATASKDVSLAKQAVTGVSNFLSNNIPSVGSLFKN